MKRNIRRIFTSKTELLRWPPVLLGCYWKLGANQARTFGTETLTGFAGNQRERPVFTGSSEL
jgi:hypothetical protein